MGVHITVEIESGRAGFEADIVERIRACSNAVLYDIDFYITTVRELDENSLRLFREAVLKVLDKIEEVGGNLSNRRAHLALLHELKTVHQDLDPPINWWLNYGDWESEHGGKLLKDVSKLSAYRPVILIKHPETQKDFVIKIRDLNLDRNYSDPRKTAIFQELIRYYGVGSLEEITVLPDLYFFKAQERRRLLQNMQARPELRWVDYAHYMNRAAESYKQRKGRGLRLAERMPEIRVPRSYEGGREVFSKEERDTIEDWFPSTIFDDYRETEFFQIYQGNRTSNIYRADTIEFNALKFENWYDNLDEIPRRKCRKSLEAVHRMVSDGFLLDLYGPLNFTIRNGEFLLIDVEPIQLSNLPIGTICISYSENILNSMFEVVGLEKISYSEIVSRIYGAGSVLELKGRKEAYLDENAGFVGPCENWVTNVSNNQELQFYRDKLKTMKAKTGYVRPRNTLPPDLIEEHNKLLEMTDHYFEGISYDWSWAA